jgi:phosphoribosylamine--glycine ligase
MKILVLGGGGREHAIVWKLHQSPVAQKIYCVPGNAGTEPIAESAKISLNNFEEILGFIEEKEIDFTVVGPEQPLVEGVVDFLERHKKLVFGPNQQAAQMEGSKIFSKNLMKKYSIPTASYGVFTDFEEAKAYLDHLPEGRIVVKADGLAAGKGSIVCQNLNEALNAIKAMMVDNLFKEAGQRVVIEEFMQGQEASIFIITDSNDYVLLSPAQDFKRAYDRDLGKNTGGMGSYAPTPVLTKTIYNRVLREIIEPTLEGLKKEGILYKGVLYCGLMVTSEGPKVVEFNCRFGDPETQVVLPLLESDLLELLLSTVNKNLKNYRIKIKNEYAVCVVAASGGYPDAYEKGKIITGLDRVEPEVMVFHAGTNKENHHIVTNGGRVLAVTATDTTLKGAVDKVYLNLNNIHFDKMHFRRDIAEKAWKMLI